MRSELNKQSLELLLEQRASQLAQKEEACDHAFDSILISFSINKITQYGVEYNKVTRLYEQNRIMHVPGINPVIKGMSYINSELVSVINPAILFNESFDKKEINFLILLESDGMKLALPIYQINDLYPYDNTEIKNTNLVDNQFISGVFNNEIAIIDAEAIFEYINHIGVDDNKGGNE